LVASDGKLSCAGAGALAPGRDAALEESLSSLVLPLQPVSTTQTPSMESTRDDILPADVSEPRVPSADEIGGPAAPPVGCRPVAGSRSVRGMAGRACILRHA
jgi:hypothetical protein